MKISSPAFVSEGIPEPSNIEPSLSRPLRRHHGGQLRNRRSLRESFRCRGGQPVDCRPSRETPGGLGRCIGRISRGKTRGPGSGREEARRRGGFRASGGAPRGPGQVVGVLRLATERANRSAAASQFSQVRLRENQGSCLTEPLNHKRIVKRHRLSQCHRAPRRWQIGGIVVVLQDDRDTV